MDTVMRGQITEIFTGETYWREGVRVSYSFGGEYWKIGPIPNNDMDRFWKEFNPYAVNNLAQAIMNMADATQIFLLQLNLEKEQHSTE